MLLPGLVDSHVHVNEPGRTAWEGFASATRAAAAGGVTTLVDMPLNSIPPTTTVEALDIKRAATDGKLSVDVAFWGGAVPDNLGSLGPLHAAGVRGFKAFLTPSGVDEFGHLDAEQLEAALAEVAALGSVLIVHAEDPADLHADGALGPRYADFLASRPAVSERHAIARVIDAMRRTGARAHVLHLSDAGSLDLIRSAKAEGLPLTVETCPHYLALRAEDVPSAATQFKCCPPIRDAGNQDLLWAAVLDGTIDAIVSDHSPSTADLKNADFGLSWGGIAGLQLGLSVVWTEARRRGIPLERPDPAVHHGTRSGRGAAPGNPHGRRARAPRRLRTRRGARGRRAHPRAQEPGLALRRRDDRRSRANRLARRRGHRRRTAPSPLRAGGTPVRERSGLAVRVPDDGRDQREHAREQHPDAHTTLPADVQQQRAHGGADEDQRDRERATRPSVTGPAGEPRVRGQAGERRRHDDRGHVLDGQPARGRGLQPHRDGQQRGDDERPGGGLDRGAIERADAQPDREHAGRGERAARAVRPARPGRCAARVRRARHRPGSRPARGSGRGSAGRRRPRAPCRG